MSDAERRQLAGAYFLYFVVVGLYIPYFPEFLRSRGFSAPEIGWILALGPLMRIVVPPLLGLAADRARGPRFWGMVAAWGATLGLLVLWRADGRIALAAGLLLFSVANAPTISLLDAAALGHLKRAGGSFGRIRLWGSVGFIAASFGFGTIFPGLPLAAIGAALAAAHTAFAAFVSFARVEEGAPAAGGWSGLSSVMRSRAVILLLLTVFLNRVASAPFNGFYTIFVRDSGHGGDVVAATWGIAVTTEVAVMLAVDRLIGRFGFGPVLAWGVLLEAARWFAYALVSSSAALLLLAPFHGIAFALLYVAGVHGLAALTPARWRSLGQGLGAAAGGLGQVVGSVAAGYAHQALGARAMFAAAGAAGVAALGFALLAGRGGGRG